jgi:hypothetical protein
MDQLQLEQERTIVHTVEQFLKEQGPFVSLAEAARLTGVPLPSLSDAVRHGRVPAVQVQPRRWLVRVSAVRSYFTNNTINPHLALQQRLMAEGLLDQVKLEQHFDQFEPFPSKGKAASETLIEERR